jgi:hypothetical protein
MDGLLALYIFMLAAFTGYEVISRVPVILHTPLMSGSNFVHGVVLVGGMIALGQAETPLAAGHRLCRRAARRGQCGGRLRGDRTHAGHVQGKGEEVMAIKWLIDASYFVAAILFILGLKGMSSPVSARKGIVWAGVGMVLATVVTFLTPGMNNFALMVIAIASAVRRLVSGKKVAMTDMPQMVAIYNGMGGGAAAASPRSSSPVARCMAPWSPLLATLGALIGAVSFSGSVRGLGQAAGGHEEGLPAAGPERGEHRAGAGDGGRWWAIVIAPTIDPMLVVAFFVLALVLGVIITCPSAAPTCRW